MRVLQALLLSLFIHLLLMVIIKSWPVAEPIKPQQIVEFDVLPKKSSQSETTKNLVRSALIPENLKIKEAQDKLKFLSDKFQRVKEQTKAATSGLTQNRKLNAQNQTQEPERADRDESLDPFSPVSKPHISKRRNSAPDSGLSTLSEEIDSRVKVGSMTALNTDRYLFYSFFARIEDLIYFRWATLVTNAEPAVAARFRGLSSTDRWNTEIEIWLKANGEFHSAHLMKGSGIPEFDRAAAQAFQQAGFFPNPPKELVEEDGLIHLKYGLTVYFDPKVLVSR